MLSRDAGHRFNLSGHTEVLLKCHETCSSRNVSGTEEIHPDRHMGTTVAPSVRKPSGACVFHMLLVGSRKRTFQEAGTRDVCLVCSGPNWVRNLGAPLPEKQFVGGAARSLPAVIVDCVAIPLDTRLWLSRIFSDLAIDKEFSALSRRGSFDQERESGDLDQGHRKIQRITKYKWR